MEGYNRYQRVPSTVWARQVAETTEVATTAGYVSVGPGDWVVIDGQTTMVMKDEFFRKNYLRSSTSGLHELNLPKTGG